MVYLSKSKNLAKRRGKRIYFFLSHSLTLAYAASKERHNTQRPKVIRKKLIRAISNQFNRF